MSERTILALPKGRILAPPPPGRTDMGTTLAIASMTLGLGRAALETTVAYIKDRRAGGKPIIQHQGAGLIIANAAMNLEAARNLSEHLVLLPEGIAFAPHPVVTDTDRDKYCVKRIVEFYQRQPTDLTEVLPLTNILKALFGEYTGR